MEHARALRRSVSIIKSQVFLAPEALDTADKKSPFAGALPGKAPAKGTHECLPYSSYSSRLAPGIAAGGGIFA